MVKVGTYFQEVLHLYILIGLLLTDYEKNIAYTGVQPVLAITL